MVKIRAINPEGKPLDISLLKSWIAAGHRKMLDNLSSLTKQPCPLCTHDGTHTGMLCYPGEPKPQEDTRARFLCTAGTPVIHGNAKGNQLYLEIKL